MANTEAHSLSLPQIGSLNPGLLPGALALSAEANWNQVAADWRLMMTHGHAVGIEMGQPPSLVASALALPMGARLAWISMVLVTASQRRLGLASRLVLDCIQWIEARGAQAVLDATAAGAEVYRPLGFETLRYITRWQHPGNAVASPRRGVMPLTAADMAWLAPLDAQIFGAKRDFVLHDLLARPDAVCLRGADEAGYILSRAGRVATQIGPLSAPEPDMAIRLLDGLLSRLPGPVFIDAYNDQVEFASHLAALGFTRQRGFERMMRGGIMQFGDNFRSFAAAGPELG